MVLSPELQALEKKLKANIARLNTIKCENSLAEFTKQAWHIIEPGTTLMWNWHLDTLCAYLEATMDPKIHLTRLIINIPPGSLKSVLVSVMFPAWMWIKNPQKRVLGVSNAQDLSIRDSRRTKQIVTDEWYTKQWPLALKADQSAKTNYENIAGGFRVSLGITANITGKRGDCFTADTYIDTEHGAKLITDVKVGDRVWSYNSRTENTELQPVDALYSSKEDREIITLNLSNNSSITCTPDHKFWTKEQGMVAAKNLVFNKSVIPSKSLYSLLSAIKLRSQPQSSIFRVHNFSTCYSVKYINSVASFWWGKVFSYIKPRPPASNFVYSSECDSVFNNAVSGWTYAHVNIDDVRGGKNMFTAGKSSVFNSVSHVVRLSTIRQITSNVINMISVQVSNFASFARLGTYKRRCHTLMDVEHSGNPVDIRTNSKIPFAIWTKFSDGPFFKIISSAFDNSIQALKSSQVRNFMHTLKSRDGSPLFITSITQHTVKSPVYCLQVRYNHNMYVMSKQARNDCFGTLVSNCILLDDPHDASTAQSDLIRQGVLDIYDTKLSTRVNSQQHSVIILIMQRLHAQDLTGHLLLKKKTKWTHVVMPMHYDSAFTFDAGKDLGKPEFNDPRQEDELLFTNLFPHDVVEKLEEDMGTYACTPAETPIRMFDGSVKQIKDIEIGDKVLGHTILESTLGKRDTSRTALGQWAKNETGVVDPVPIVSEVTELFSYENRPVIQYHMEDGAVLRCTAEHKWFKPTAFVKKYIYSPIRCVNVPGHTRKAVKQWKGTKPSVLLEVAQDGTSLVRNRVKYYVRKPRQTVYALTTTTGNYVAWDHVSSNSAGQLEQRPSPKGGGILREEWFRVLDETANDLPVCEHVFISCDTAYSEKDMHNNSFSAFTTWGVFWNKAQQRDCVLLLDVWFDQVDYPELRRHAHKMDKEKKPDVWLIEKKASGQSLVQDLRQSGLTVRTYVPTTDKISRAYAIQPMLESGQVWIPDRKWATAFAYTMGTFPTGNAASFDLADTCTQALLYIRNGMYVSHPDDLEHTRPEVRRISAYGAHSTEVDKSEKQKSLVADEEWRD